MNRNMVKGAMAALTACVMVVFIAGIGPAWASVCSGTMLTVTTLNDEQNVNGLCSLREAIINANNDDQSGSIDCPAGCGSDTIDFSVTGTITLSSQLPKITQTLTIDGPGAGSLTISGNDLHRVIFVDTAIVTIQDVTIAHGYYVGDDDGGGGIYNSGGTLTVDNCTFSNNNASRSGGAIYNNTGVALNVTNSTFSGNSALDYAGGGIYNFNSTLTIANSTFSGNSAFHGGGIYNFNNATANITNCTFSGNSVLGDGGGVAIFVNSTANITNSTFSDNIAAYGGGISNYISATASVTNCTLSGNQSAHGSGIFNDDNSTLTLQNSIIANSLEDGDCYNTATLISNGYNLDTDNTCNLTQPTDLPNTSPQLGVLADNGGPTDTMALGSGSPAIDTIPFGVNGCGTTMTTDQRGFLRPIPSGGSCDIGAYEADLQTVDLSGSWSVLYSLSRGTNLSGILRTRNTGTGNAGSFKVAIYLSSNGVTPGSLLKTFTVAGLNAGASKNISFSYISNISLSGKYLIAVIDSGNQITETNESNNRAVVKIQ